VAVTTLVVPRRLWDSSRMSSEATPRLRLLMLTARRHVDYGRVRSAMCPAFWRRPTTRWRGAAR